MAILIARRLLIPCMLAIFPVATVSAQPGPYRVQQLAEGVYAMLRDYKPTGAADSNVLIIINDVDVVVVDANIYPASTRQTIDEIRKLTSKPVRYVINTHWHGDHHFGNRVYQETFPGVEIVAHPLTRELVISRELPSLEKNLTTEYPAIIARLRKALETGKRSNGEPVTAEQRTQFTQALELYEFFIRDLATTRPLLATMTVADSLVLVRGERTIVVKFLGRGNTPGDLIVHLPNERIVATGDLVVHPVPFAFFAYLSEWPNTLRTLTRIDATKIVPGHGPVQTDWSYVNRLIPLFETTWDQVRKAVASGADLEATRKAVNVDSHRDGFGGSTPEARQLFDALFLNPAIESAFKELRPDSTSRN